MNKILLLSIAISLSACTYKQEVLVPEPPHNPKSAIITEDNTIIFYRNIWGDIKRQIGIE